MQNTLRLILAGLLLVSVAACRKKRETAASDLPAGKSATGPTTPSAAPEPPKEVPPAVALHHLNNAVRNYYADKTKMPTTLEDVYQAGYLKERFTPPAGRQFVINPQTQAVELR